MTRILLISCFVVILTACGIQRTAEETHAEVVSTHKTSRELLGHTEAMHDGVHLQTLSVSLQNMLAPHNTQVLAPPYRMLPYAKKT